MKRREFMRFLGLGASASIVPLSLRAQTKMHRLAFVHSGVPADKLTESDGPFWVQKVYRTLRQLGDIEGQNFVVERFSANGRSEQFASLAAEVVARKPDVIVVNFNDLAKQFTIATSTIPLVVITGDPIAAGLLTNLARPGGNLTGVSINAGVEIYGKRLQIIKEARPKSTKVAALFSGALSGMSDYEEAARRLGIELVASLADQYREIGVYTGHVLQGAGPADLPIAQPTMFEFVINLNTARGLGITLPPGVLAIADEVIE